MLDKFIFLKAAEHLKKVGLNKDGHFWKDVIRASPVDEFCGLPCCVLGAIKTTLLLEDTGYNYVRYDEYRWHLRAYVEGGDVTKWNDAPERTVEDVVALLEKAGDL